MTNNKNNIHQFEEQQFIQEEKQIEQIQEILNKFSQPMPDGFVKLEQLNWMCSTQNWKEPLCERYSCLVNDKWSQVDIPSYPFRKIRIGEKYSLSGSYLNYCGWQRTRPLPCL